MDMNNVQGFATPSDQAVTNTDSGIPRIAIDPVSDTTPMPDLSSQFLMTVEEANDADAVNEKYSMANSLRNIGIEPFPELGADARGVTLGNMSAGSSSGSVGNDMSKGMFIGADKGASEMLDAAAFIAGAPVELAKNVMNFGLEAVGMEPVKNAFGDIESMKGMMDSYKGFVNDLIPMPDAIVDWASQPYDNQALGELTAGITQFGVAGFPAAKMVKAMTTYNPVARGFIWGAIADFTSLNPDDKTIVNAITEYLELAPPAERDAVLQGFMSQIEKYDSDSELVKRAKNAQDGMFIGAVVEGAIKTARLIPFGQIIDGTKRAIGRAGDAADARIAERATDTSVTLTAGADPMPMIDEAISAAGRSVRTDDVILSEAGLSAMKDAPQSYGAGGLPLRQSTLDKADTTTQMIVREILKRNPDTPVGLSLSGSAAGPSNYISFMTPDGKWGQIRVSDHSTGTARLFDYVADFPMKMPPDGKQVFGQISKASFDKRLNNLFDLFGNKESDELKTVLDLRAEQMKLPVGQRVQPSTDNVIFDLEAKPGENQSPYERNMPEQSDTPVPRAPDGATLPLNNRGAKVIGMSEQISDVLADRAQPLVGSNVQYFYHTGPIIDKAVELGIPEETAREQLKKFALNYAATSPRTMTEQNLRNASLVTAKQKRGVELTEMIGPGGEGVNEKGYPMMINPGGIHKKLVDEAAGDGLNFDTNPKPATFAENVSGNLAGVTADTHAIRAVFDAMNEIEPGSIPIEFIGGKNAKATKEMRAQYLADPSSLDPATMINDTLATQKINGQSVQTEYAIFSDIYKKVAEKIGVKPAEAQSLSWFANGQKTGLASEPKTIVELIDERVDVTAQMLGQTKDEVFKKFMQGSIPLLSLGGLTLPDTGAMQQNFDEEMQWLEQCLLDLLRLISRSSVAPDCTLVKEFVRLI